MKRWLIRPIVLLSGYASLLAASLPLHAQQSWTDRTTAAGIGGELNDVAWGGGLFITVGTNTVFGLIHSSPDGVTWADHTEAAGIGGILNGVAYGDNRFVAVGTNTAFGILASSFNGMNWSDHTSAANIGGILRDVAYGNGVWVAVGDIGGVGVVATSTNGTTWTNRTATAGISGVLNGITYADGRFVTVGTNGALVAFATSTNGRDWNVHTTTNAIGGVAFDVTHDGTQFIATGEGTPSGASTTAHVLTSPDGISWTSRTLDVDLGGIGLGIGSGGGTTVLVGRTGAPGLLATSSNGIDWENLTEPVEAPGDLHGVTRGLSTWVAVGTNRVNGVVMTSDDEFMGGGEPMFFDDVLEVGSAGGSVQVNVVAGDGVDWEITKDADWIFISGAGGTGDGRATLSVQPNGSADARSATLSVGTDSLTINQAGTPLGTPVLNGFYQSDSDEVRLSWNQIFAAAGYQVERRTSPEGSFALLAEPVGAATTMVVDADLGGGVSYDYRVRAVAGTLVSDWSNSVTVGAPPDIPDDLTATARNASQVELRWSDVEGERAYLIYRAANEEPFFEKVARVPADETRHIDSGLDPASVYRYQIEAESDIFGRRSTEVPATTEVEDRSIHWNRAEISLSRYLGIAIGKGTTVVVGSGGRVTTSTDLAMWSEQTPPTSETLRAIAFAQDQFVAVGDEGVIVVSPDGETWSAPASPEDDDLTGIAFSGGLWVGVGAGGAVMTSADGLLWTSQASPAATGFVTIFAGGDRFVAVEETGRFLTSDDGLTWRETRADAPSDATEPFFWTRTAGAFGMTSYSVVGPNSYHSFGPDAVSWSEQTDNAFNYFEAVAYGSGRFVAVGTNGRTGYSETGQGYLNGASLGTSLFCIAHGPGGFVSAGDRGIIVTSPDGIIWTTVQEPQGTTAHLDTILAGGGRLVAFGENDFDTVTVRNSFDGGGWTEEPLSIDGFESSPRINDGLFVSGQFVIVGNGGLIATSPNGERWTARRTSEPGAFSDDLRGIAAGDGQLLVGGGDDPLLRSNDNGSTWEPVPDLPDRFAVWNLTYGSRWVGHFGGFGSLALYHSDDGSTWSPGFVFGDGRNVSQLALGQLGAEPIHVGAGAQFGGDSPQAMVSWDGRNWHAVAPEGIDGDVAAIAFGAGVFVAVGGGSNVWASLDGAHWEAAPEGFLPEEVWESGGPRDITYFRDRFYGVGLSGLIVELVITSSDFLPGPGVEPARVDIVRAGDAFALQWPSVAEVEYQIFGRPDLATGDWIPQGDAIIGDGDRVTFDAVVPEGETEWYWIVVSTVK